MKHKRWQREALHDPIDGDAARALIECGANMNLPNKEGDALIQKRSPRY